MITDLRIVYDGEEINTKLDNALRQCLKEFGLFVWASGYNLETNKRDIAFENKRGV